MDSIELSLRQAIGVVIPDSINRAKQFARHVQKAYGDVKLSQCQQAVAHVFGHADWYSLDKAIKSGSRQPRYDEELSDEQFSERRKAQTAMLALDLCGIHPDEDCDPLEPLSMPALGILDPHNLMRLEQGEKRSDRLFCEMLLFDLSPTSLRLPERHAVEQSSLELAPQDVMEWFPQHLARWWKRSVKHQPSVVQGLESIAWDKDSTSSIVSFGAAWGKICMLMSGTLNWQMCMGTAYLLADQYSAAVLQQSREFNEEAAEADDLASVSFSEEVQMQKMGLLLEYLHHYVRDDMVKAPLPALRSNAQKVLGILRSKTSKAGTWRM